MNELEKRKEDIIRYVANEMDEEEKKRFERILSTDIDLQSEVNELLATRHQLSQWPDRQFEVPSFSELDESNHSNTSIRRLLPMKKWMSYAAAILLLLTFSWLTGLQVTQEDNALTLSFGPIEQKKSMNPEEISSIVDQAIAKYTVKTANEKAAFQEGIDDQLDNMEQRMTARLTALNGGQLKEIKQNLSNHERQQLVAIQELVQGLQLEQRVVLQETILAVLDQVEQQRLENRMDLETAFQRINEFFANLQLSSEQNGMETADNKFIHY